MRALEDGEAVIFDVPGIGGSPPPLAPYRPSTDGAARARPGSRSSNSARTSTSLACPGAADWRSSSLASIRRCAADWCLIATAPGVTMLPGNPSVILKMAQSAPLFRPRPHAESIAADLYGGAFRKDPTLIRRHAEAMKGATRYGYFLQLAAMTGWTSIHWLHTLKQQTLILAGADDPLVPAFNARVLARPHPEFPIWS